MSSNWIIDWTYCDVKFVEQIEDGDDDEVFTVIEDRGDRVVCQPVKPRATEFAIVPTFVYAKNDLYIV